MVLEVDDVVLETVKLAVARVPSPIVPLFKPLTRQMYWPELGALQEMVLLAPETDGPATTEGLLKSVGEKVNVHSRPEA